MHATLCKWICGKATLNLSEIPALPIDADGPVFDAPWQAQAFAMVVSLHAGGVFTWAEWGETLSVEIKSSTKPYYEHWLAALETIVCDKQVIGESERVQRIQEWDIAAHQTPHGQPITLSRLWSLG